MEGARVGIIDGALRCDEGQVNRFSRVRDRLENRPFAVQLVKQFLVWSEQASGVFDFAEVDDVVGSVNEEVDLRTIGAEFIGFMAPGTGVCQNAADLKGVLDLGERLKTHTLKGKPLPIMLRREVIGRPEMLVIRLSVISQIIARII